MRYTSIVAALFAAGSLAMPLNKRETDLTIVTEVEYVDQNGNVISIAYETGAPSAVGGGSTAPTPAPQAPQSPAAGGSSPSQAPAAQSPAPAPASPAPASPSAPASSPAASPASGSSSTAAAASSAPSTLSETSGGSASQDVQNYIKANSNDATTFQGWVDPSDSRFAEIAVYHHNVHRANHSVSMVSWNQSMADLAQSWAEQCTTEESVPAGSGMGQNVAFSSTSDNYNPSDWITGSWYNSELENYPGYGIANLAVGDGTSFNSWGHFSQLVWPNVTQIGCGVYNGCSGGFSVHSGCYYYVEGNIEGEFNVINAPGGAPVVFPNGQNSM